MQLFWKRRGGWHLDVGVEPVQLPRGVRDELAVRLQDRVALVNVPEGRAADEARDVVQSEGERGDHTEVAPAAAQRPEQVGFLGGAGTYLPAVGEHDICGKQVVDGQAVGPRQVPEAAAKCEATDAGGGDDAAGGGEPVCAGGCVHLAPGAAAADPHGPALGIHLDGVQACEVDDQTVVAGAQTGPVVTSTADGEEHSLLPGSVDAAYHVVHGAHLSDQRGGLVDHGVVHALGGVVAGIGRPDRGAVEVG